MGGQVTSAQEVAYLDLQPLAAYLKTPDRAIELCALHVQALEL